MMEWAASWGANHNGILVFLGVWLCDYVTGIRLAAVQERFQWMLLLKGWGKLWWLVILLVLQHLASIGVQDIGGIPLSLLQLLPLKDVGPSFLQNLEGLGVDVRLPGPLGPSKRDPFVR